MNQEIAHLPFIGMAKFQCAILHTSFELTRANVPVKPPGRHEHLCSEWALLLRHRQ